MEFIPNSIIRLLSGVPLDNTYKDTLTFANATDQANFMLAKSIYYKTDLTYSKYVKGQLRLDVLADDVYNTNYLMFQNNNFGSKWFYAFVTDIEYINPTTTTIHYEIDVMQTWMFNYSIKKSFVEREHVSDDTIGSHTVPEGLELGGYITTDTSSYLADGLHVFLLATEPGPSMNNPTILGGFPIPTYWRDLGDVANPGTITALNDLVTTYGLLGKAEAVVAIFTAPMNMLSLGSGPATHYLNCADRTLTITPKNNKLYTFPYVSLAMQALGQGVELRYEYFTSTPQIKIEGGFGANLQVSAIPINYGGQSQAIQYAMSIKDFPLVPWLTNYFQNWLAQNRAGIAVSNIGNVLGIIGSGTSMALNAVAGSPLALGGVGGIMSGVGGIAQNMVNVYQHSILPDRMNGSANASDIFAITGKTGFYTYCRTIRAEYAQMIDDYFSMFGYKVNSVKEPNINGRASWNYVKTVDAVIVGTCPASVVSKIREILNRGITYWHGDYVGDYSRANGIV